LHMAKTHVSPWTINATIVALRFFFRVTLERDDLIRPLIYRSQPGVDSMCSSSKCSLRSKGSLG
jgi:hypothetical protein